MWTVRSAQRSHGATPQEGLGPGAVKSSFPDPIASVRRVCSLGGRDGDSTAQLATNNIGIGHIPVGGTERFPVSENIHLHLSLTLRGAICHEPHFCVCWKEKTGFQPHLMFSAPAEDAGGLKSCSASHLNRQHEQPHDGGRCLPDRALGGTPRAQAPAPHT